MTSIQLHSFHITASLVLIAQVMGSTPIWNPVYGETGDLKRQLFGTAIVLINRSSAAIRDSAAYTSKRAPLKRTCLGFADECCEANFSYFCTLTSIRLHSFHITASLVLIAQVMGSTPIWNPV